MIVSVRLLTSLVSAEQIGRMNLLISGIAIFSLALMNPVGVYLTRHIYSLNYQGQVLSGINGYLLYCALIGAVASISLLLFDFFFGLGIQMSPIILILLAFAGIFATSGQLQLVGLLNTLNNNFMFVFLSALIMWGGVLVSATMVMLISHTAESWYGGQMLAQFVVLLLVIWYYHRRFPGKMFIFPKMGRFRHLIGFSWPFTIGAFIYWLQIHGFRFLLENYGTVRDVGIFAVSFGLGCTFVSMMESIMSQICLPSFYKGITTPSVTIRSQAWENFSSVMIPGMMIACFFGIGLSFSLIAILTDTPYHQYGWLFALGAVAEFFRTVSSTWGMIAHSEQRTSKLLPVGIGGVIPLCFFCFISPWLGPLKGMAVTLISSQLVSMILMIYLMSKLLSVSFPPSRVLRTLLLGLPLLVFLMAGRSIHPLFSIILGGAYFAMVEYYLLRKIFQRSKVVL